MRTIQAAAITETVAKLCIQANTHLPGDIVAALDAARQSEPWPLARETLGLLWNNLELAEEKNLPVCQDTGMAPGDACKITVAPKGFGSENMSRLGMLKPADGVEGVKRFVVETVRLAGSNPCPPTVLGVGIGGSFDKAAYLAKHALLRPIDQRNPDPFYAALETELLDEINALGVGPQGFGGKTTCLGLSIETAPTHVAGLPVAVNVSCHVTRRASAQL